MCEIHWKKVVPGSHSLWCCKLLLLLLVRNIWKIKFIHMFLHFFHQIHFYSVFFCSILIFRLKIFYCIYIVVLISQAYSESCQTSKMEIFVKIVNGLKSLAIFAKNFILDVLQGSKYSFRWLDIIVRAFLKNK